MTGSDMFAMLRIMNGKLARMGEDFCQQAGTLRGSVYHDEHCPGKTLGKLANELTQLLRRADRACNRNNISRHNSIVQLRWTLSPGQ